MFAVIYKCYKMKLPSDIIQLELFEKMLNWHFYKVHATLSDWKYSIESSWDVKLGKSTNTCKLDGETGRRNLKCTIEKRTVNMTYTFILSLHKIE